MLCELTRHGAKSINYNHDDPFGPRDGRKWDLYRKCVPLYDLLVVVRKENVDEARRMGAKNVTRIFRPYDPIGHAPLPENAVDRKRWAAEVVFVGNWMPERGPFMARLMELGVPVNIYGTEWKKAPEWKQLASIVRSSVYGPDYVMAIQYSKIALGLLSKGNRDLHTTRSSEIPFIGGAVLCAERTIEHESMFRDGEQAVFWTTPEECASVCKQLLADETARKAVSVCGRKRIIELGYSNDQICAEILEDLTAEDTSNHVDILLSDKKSATTSGKGTSKARAEKA
jgi:hypothetical protein